MQERQLTFFSGVQTKNLGDIATFLCQWMREADSGSTTWGFLQHAISFPMQLVEHWMPHANRPHLHPLSHPSEGICQDFIWRIWRHYLCQAGCVETDKAGKGQWHCRHWYYRSGLTVFEVAFYSEGLEATYSSPLGTLSLSMISYSLTLRICVRTDKIDMQQYLKIMPKLTLVPSLSWRYLLVYNTKNKTKSLSIDKDIWFVYSQRYKIWRNLSKSRKAQISSITINRTLLVPSCIPLLCQVIENSSFGFDSTNSARLFYE